MPKRGEWLQNQTAQKRQQIASNGGNERAKRLGKKRTRAIVLRAAAVWSAQQKAKKQALSKP